MKKWTNSLAALGYLGMLVWLVALLGPLASTYAQPDSTIEFVHADYDTLSGDLALQLGLATDVGITSAALAIDGRTIDLQLGEEIPQREQWFVLDASSGMVNAQSHVSAAILRLMDSVPANTQTGIIFFDQQPVLAAQRTTQRSEIQAILSDYQATVDTPGCLFDALKLLSQQTTSPDRVVRGLMVVGPLSRQGVCEGHVPPSLEFPLDLLVIADEISTEHEAIVAQTNGNLYHANLLTINAEIQKVSLSWEQPVFVLHGTANDLATRTGTLTLRLTDGEQVKAPLTLRFVEHVVAAQQSIPIATTGGIQLQAVATELPTATPSLIPTNTPTFKSEMTANPINPAPTVVAVVPTVIPTTSVEVPSSQTGDTSAPSSPIDTTLSPTTILTATPESGNTMEAALIITPENDAGLTQPLTAPEQAEFTGNPSDETSPETNLAAEANLSAISGNPEPTVVADVVEPGKSQSDSSDLNLTLIGATVVFIAVGLGLAIIRLGRSDIQKQAEPVELQQIDTVLLYQTGGINIQLTAPVPADWMHGDDDDLLITQMMDDDDFQQRQQQSEESIIGWLRANEVPVVDYEIRQQGLLIGSDLTCDVVIRQDTEVQSQHIRLEVYSGSEVWLSALNIKQPVIVSGQLVLQGCSCRLQSQSVIKLTPKTNLVFIHRNGNNEFDDEITML